MRNGKWRVMQSQFRTHWRVYPPYLFHPTAKFPTWKEAWDYAIAKATEVGR